MNGCALPPSPRPSPTGRGGKPSLTPALHTQGEGETGSFSRRKWVNHQQAARAVGRVSEAPPDKTTAHRATVPGNNEWVRSATLTPALSHRERGKTEPHSGPSYTGRGRNRQFQSRKWVNHQQVARTPGRARREPPPGIKAAPSPLLLPGGAALARAYGER